MDLTWAKANPNQNQTEQNTLFESQHLKDVMSAEGSEP